MTKEDIMSIAMDITGIWNRLGRALGLSDSNLSIIDEDNGKIYDKCYAMLMKWKQIYVSRANYGALEEGLAHTTVERHDLIKKYCEVNKVF